MEWLAKAAGAVFGTLARFITRNDLKRAWRDVAVGVAVIVAGGLILALILDSPWGRIDRRLKTQNLPPASGAHFTILLADLDGDTDRIQTSHVELALQRQPGIRVRRYGKVLRIADLGDTADNIAAAERQGREWLEAQNADVLIWGGAFAAEKVLRLRYLPRSVPAETGLKSYVLTETLELPESFGADLADVLYAVVLASVAPATEQTGRYLVELLKPAAEKIAHLIENPTSALPAEQLATVQVAFGVAAAVLGEQTGEQEWLMRAVAAQEAALEIHTRDRLPLQWAATQNNLGNALAALGEREEGTARLEGAVAAHRAALEVYTRDRLPLQWAATQNNLGNALAALGEREKGAARLAEAVAAYRAALEVYTRDRLPLDWAATQNNLCNALAALGEREEGTARLEEAVAACRAALEVYTRDRLPLDWAMTQNNLGNALQALGAREAGTARLEEAVAAYRAALTVRTSDRLPFDWAMTQNNLGVALETLGEREEGTVRLEEAATAFRAALEVFERAGATHYIATTRANLARAERLIAARRGN